MTNSTHLQLTYEVSRILSTTSCAADSKIDVCTSAAVSKVTPTALEREGMGTTWGEKVGHMINLKHALCVNNVNREASSRCPGTRTALSSAPSPS